MVYNLAGVIFLIHSVKGIFPVGWSFFSHIADTGPAGGLTIFYGPVQLS